MNAEDWLQELDAAIQAYRAAEKVGPVSKAAALEEALARTRKLGLTDGESARYLDAKPGRR